VQALVVAALFSRLRFGGVLVSKVDALVSGSAMGTGASTSPDLLAGMTPAEFREKKQRHRESPEAAADPKLLLGPRNEGLGVEGERRPAPQSADRAERSRTNVIGYVDGLPVSLGDFVEAEARHRETGDVAPALGLRSSSFTATRKTGPFGTSACFTAGP
jgi:hypothetical protein